jgi:hypothetical protein
MAQFQYDGVRPASKLNVTKSGGSSIDTNAVRVTIDDANAVSKAEALLILEAICDKVREDTWPPA